MANAQQFITGTTDIMICLPMPASPTGVRATFICRRRRNMPIREAQ